ncbi:hypothetical protein E2320_010809 [Naja naja]|nr:hypothetical protein E2320_010809 [Naja naja]
MDMFATISVDKYSFPSGHATRAAMSTGCTLDLHSGSSRIMLGRHNVTDVVFGLIMGYMQYNLVEYFWLSPVNAPVLFALWN